MKEQYIIGLDLSKASTGFSLFSISPDNTLKYLSSGDFSFKEPHRKNSYTKLYSRAKIIILGKLSEWFEIQRSTYGLHSENTTVSLEAPIFSQFSSEIQFYLNHCVLEYFDSLHIDVVGYVPLNIKLFAKCCAEGFVFEKSKKALTKDQMKDIYQKYLFKLNPKSLPSAEDMSDDEIDAIYIALTGAICHTRFLPIPSTKEDIGEGLYKDKDAFLDDFKENTSSLKFKGIKFAKKLSVHDQFKPLFKNLIGTNHLTLRSKHYYPYSQVNHLNLKHKFLALNDVDADKELLKEALNIKDQKLANILNTTNNEPASLDFLFDNLGNLRVE